VGSHFQGGNEDAEWFSTPARARLNKEMLFTDGELTAELGDDLFEIKLEEFLADQHVAAFSRRLRERFHRTLSTAVTCAKSYPQLTGQRTPVEIMLTGGGHSLPMVRALCETPSTVPAPDLAERPQDLDFDAVRRQLAVAVGGAVRDLPTQTAPVRLSRH
jgi:hypothetical protein